MPQIPSSYRAVRIQRGLDIELLLNKLKRAEVFCYIAGGYARWMVSLKNNPANPGDVDLYFQDFSSFSKAKNCLEESRCILEKESNNAITFSPYNMGISNKIQLIKTSSERSGEIFEILNNFDLSVCQAAVMINSDTNTLGGFASLKFLDTEADNRLRIIKIGNPMSTMIRCIKYAKYGYMIGPKQLVKILNVWDAMSPELRAATREMISKETSANLEADLYSMVEA